MKSIAEFRIHIGELHDHGLRQVAMVDVEKCLDEIERELEEEYAPLPKDADGVPIRVGDVMYAAIDDELWGEKVSYLCLQDDGWRIGNIGYVADAMTHRKPTTVEDVLQKLLEQAVGYSDAHTTVALDAIAEYAERLQLRKED